MSIQTNKPGDTVFIVQRARVLAARPRIKGVVSVSYSKDARMYGIAIKVDAGDPKIFATREVFSTEQEARQAAYDFILQAEDDSHIAYARSRAALNKARAANHQINPITAE